MLIATVPLRVRPRCPFNYGLWAKQSRACVGTGMGPAARVEGVQACGPSLEATAVAAQVGACTTLGMLHKLLHAVPLLDSPSMRGPTLAAEEASACCYWLQDCCIGIFRLLPEGAPVTPCRIRWMVCNNYIKQCTSTHDKVCLFIADTVCHRAGATGLRCGSDGANFAT